eukprot:1885861-Rhodomonas_salina.1
MFKERISKQKKCDDRKDALSILSEFKPLEGKSISREMNKWVNYGKRWEENEKVGELEAKKRRRWVQEGIKVNSAVYLLPAVRS